MCSEITDLSVDVANDKQSLREYVTVRALILNFDLQFDALHSPQKQLLD